MKENVIIRIMIQNTEMKKGSFMKIRNSNIMTVWTVDTTCCYTVSGNTGVELLSIK